MKSHNQAISLICTMALLNMLSAHAEPEHFADVFRKVLPRMERAVSVMDEGADLPDRALFGKDKRSNSKDVDKLLDKAIETLGVASVSDTRAQLRELEAKIAAHYEQLDEYRRERITARENAILGVDRMPFAVSKKGYDDKIVELELLIGSEKEQVEELKHQFAEELATIGLDLTPAQVDQVLSTVEGDDFVEMTVAFDNVKHITVKLEELMAAGSEDPTAARRYYGMYVVLLRMLDRIQFAYIERIDEDHLPKLKEFEKEAKDIAKEAAKLLPEASADNRKHLEANIASAELTQEAIALYREYLGKQRETVESMNATLAGDLKTAENTYRTVTLSQSLAALMREGMEHFDALTKLSAPKLVVFENAAVEEEFRKLTAKMKR